LESENKTAESLEGNENKENQDVDEFREQLTGLTARYKIIFFSVLSAI